MMNQVVLIGKVVSVYNGNMLVRLEDDGNVPVKIWDGLEKHAEKFFGKIVGVKGKLDAKGTSIGVIAERVSVLTVGEEEKDIEGNVTGENAHLQS